MNSVCCRMEAGEHNCQGFAAVQYVLVYICCCDVSTVHVERSELEAVTT
jgi:hypothetical protein